jgi:WD40 repeat protein
MPITSVRFRNDGKGILTGCSDGVAQVWDPSTGSSLGPEVRHTGGAISAVDFDPDGDTLLTAGGTSVLLWDASSGARRRVSINHPGPIFAARFRPDGKAVLTGGINNTAQLWDASTGRAMGIPMIHQGSVLSVAFGPHGRTILTGSHDRTARLWDAESGIPLGPPMMHPERVSAVTFGPLARDYMVATGCEDGRIRTWDVPTAPVESRKRLELWIETMTGLTLDVEDGLNGIVRVLDDSQLREKRRELAKRGGAPRLGPSVAAGSAD